MGQLSGRKAVRLDRIRNLLCSRADGFTVNELAERCGVNPRTIRRDLLELQSDPFYLPLRQRPGHRWAVDPNGHFTLKALNLSLQEGAALYLAARLLDRVCDEPNHHVARALESLAHVLPEHAGQTILRLTKEGKAARSGRPEDRFSRIFGCLAQGWGLGRKVRMKYHSLSSNRISEFTFSPYGLEPSPWGWGLYAIGWAEPPNQMRTYKLERVIDAELSDETFEAPEDFDPKEHLAGAWGVWRSDEAPVRVRVRFRPEVARRVKETEWHDSQRIVETEDGGCELTADVAEPTEMLPWLRSWGAACEVLEPEDLRKRMMLEALKLATVYG